MSPVLIMDPKSQTPPSKVTERGRKQNVKVSKLKTSPNKEEARESQNERKPGGEGAESSRKKQVQMNLLHESMVGVLKLNPVVCLSKMDGQIAKEDLKAKYFDSSKFRLAQNPIRKKKQNLGKTSSNVRKIPDLEQKDGQTGMVRGNTGATAPTNRIMTIAEFSASDFLRGVCRVCSEESDKCADIFNKERKLDHLVNKFLPIFVTQDDDQPSIICKGCLTTLLAVNNLSVKCVSKAAQPPSEETNAKPKSEETKERKEQISDLSKRSWRKSRYSTKKPAMLSSADVPSEVSVSKLPTSPVDVEREKLRHDDLSSSKRVTTLNNQKTYGRKSTADLSMKKAGGGSIIDAAQTVDQQQSPSSPIDLLDDLSSTRNDDSESESGRRSPTVSKIISMVSRELNVNKKAVGALLKQRKDYKEQVFRLRTRLKSKKRRGVWTTEEQSDSAGGAKMDVVKFLRNTLRGGHCKEMRKKGQDWKESDENKDQNTTLLSVDHDVTKLVDISDVDKHAAVALLQKTLQLTKKCLKVQVLLPSSETAKKQEPSSILKLPSKDFKQVVETSVEVYSNTIRDITIPVYYRILNETFPSEKIKQTICSTIVNMLSRRKKDALFKFGEQNGGECTQTIFKRFEELLKSNPNQETVKCVDCDGMLPLYEILSHIKFVHMYQCSQCKVVRHSRDALYHHTYSMHVSAKECAVCNRLGDADQCDHFFNCSVCNEGFFKYGALMQHEGKHFESDFKDLIYRLEPSCEDSFDLRCILSNYQNQKDIFLLDYFWDKDNLPRECFLTLKHRLFCIRCFKMHVNTFVFHNHVCAGEDMYLRVNFRTMACVKCDKHFRTRSVFLSHYMECIDTRFDIVKASSSNLYPVKIKCTLCLSTFQSFGEFKAHTKSCFNVNLYHCNTCRSYVGLTAKRKHLEKHSKKNGGCSRLQQLSLGKRASPENRSKAQNSEESKITAAKGQDNTSSSINSIAPDGCGDGEVESTTKQVEVSSVQHSNAPVVSTEIHPGIMHGGDVFIRKPDSKTTAHQSTVLGGQKASMNTWIDDGYNDFVGIPSSTSTPLSKKARDSASQVVNVDADKAIAINDLVGDPLSQQSADVSTTGICSPCNSAGGKANQINRKSGEDIVSADKLESAETISEPPRVVKTVNCTSNSSGNNQTKRIQTDASHLSSSVNNEQSGSVSQSYVRKRFTVKILTKPTVEEVGLISNQHKFIENQDPNPDNNLIKLLRDSTKAGETEGIGTADSKLITISYSIYYAEKNGELFPHHFRLASSNLPQVMREKALSVIRTLMQKESQRIKEASKKGDLGVNQSITKTYARKFLKDSLQNNQVSGRVGETTSSLRGHEKFSVTSVSSCAADQFPKTSPIQGSRLNKCYHCEKFFKRDALLQHCKESHMVQCETCQVFLSSSNELSDHRYIVHNVPFVVCTTCSKKFGNGEDVHSCTHEFSCTMCSKKYHNWLEYLDHELVEFCRKVDDPTAISENESEVPTLVKPLSFPCKVCGRRYSDLLKVSVNPSI